MALSAGLAVWKSIFQLNPILFQNGIASALGGFMSVTTVMELINTPLGVTSGATGDESSLDNFFANFSPLPGGTIFEQEIARYPFANQAVAANATIAMPKHISMLMVCPARNDFGYYEKLPIISALQYAIQLHCNAGGTFIVITPSFIYTSCILRQIRDVSSAISKQPQSAWLWDFEQPLITLGDAQAAQSSLMQKLTALLQNTGPQSWSGPAATAGNPLAAAPIPGAVNTAAGWGALSIPSTPLPPPTTASGVSGIAGGLAGGGGPGSLQ